MVKRELLDFYVEIFRIIRNAWKVSWLSYVNAFFVFSLSTRWTISADYNSLYGNQVSDLGTAGERKSGKDGWYLSAKKLFLWWGKMVLPFERQPLLHKRYATLSSPDLSRSFSEENEDSARGDEYAAFLKWATFFCLLV